MTLVLNKSNAVKPQRFAFKGLDCAFRENPEQGTVFTLHHSRCSPGRQEAWKQHLGMEVGVIYNRPSQTCWMMGRADGEGAPHPSPALEGEDQPLYFHCIWSCNAHSSYESVERSRGGPFPLHGHVR